MMIVIFFHIGQLGMIRRSSWVKPPRGSYNLWEPQFCLLQMPLQKTLHGLRAKLYSFSVLFLPIEHQQLVVEKMFAKAWKISVGSLQAVAGQSYFLNVESGARGKREVATDRFLGSAAFLVDCGRGVPSCRPGPRWRDESEAGRNRWRRWEVVP